MLKVRIDGIPQELPRPLLRVSFGFADLADLVVDGAIALEFLIEPIVHQLLVLDVTLLEVHHDVPAFVYEFLHFDSLKSR